MKSVIGLLLGLAVMPAGAENAATGQPAAAAVTPAALLRTAEEYTAARNDEAVGALAPPPAKDPTLGRPNRNLGRSGPTNESALLPPPPPFNPNSGPRTAPLTPPSVNARAVVPAPPAVAAPPGPAQPMPKRALSADFAGPDIAVILARNQFFPSTIRLHSGNTTRLLFTTVNRKPGALILERLQVQRWIPGEPAPAPLTESERAKQEVDREINAQKITEIIIDPKPGSYTFYDALSGAAGEIIVE